MTLMHALAAHAVEAATSLEASEQVLVTGSLIRGTPAVGTPLTQLTAKDFAQTGAITTSDLLRTIPQFNVSPGPVATNSGLANAEKGTRVNLRQLDTGTAPRSLFLIDGVRYPPQGDQQCQIDPSIIPTIAIQRVDLFLDGASATYGSDAIGGVINLILRHGYDGALTELGYTTAAGGYQQYMASQLWGRSWDGGNITLGYQWYDAAPTPGNFNSKLTFDHSPWGLDNRIPLGSSTPGTISTGAPASADASNYPGNLGANCTNCFAIPPGTGADFNPLASGIGPTDPFSASTLNWATFNTAANRGTNGPRNEFNPYNIGTYSAAVQYNGAFVTVDQRLTRDVSFFGDAFYGMRRASYAFNDPVQQLSVAVPTWNPYYPTGGAPTNLRVNYHIGIESPSLGRSWARGMRYLGGLNIDLPSGWAAQAYYSLTQDNESFREVGAVTRAAVSAALGWTLPATAAVGSSPGIGTWTKPATVPYLNLFCDPTVFRCNAGAVLRYVEGFRQTSEYFSINEKGIKADGPLFDLPAGQVKAAVGATYTSIHSLTEVFQTSGSNPTVSILSDPESRRVWAVFGQLNVPIVREENALPGVNRLELEASWRHDQYNDFGGTSDPRIGVSWEVSRDVGLTARAAWGTAFRAPNFGEFSAAGFGTNGFGLQNTPGVNFANNVTVSIGCDPATGRPPSGSGAEKLFNAGFACNAQPAGISVGGGAAAVDGAKLRSYTNVSEATLGPETSTNWSIGFDLAPPFVRGLEFQATWYSIKITNIVRSFGNVGSTSFNNSGSGFTWLVPSELRDPITGSQLCPGMDPTPTLCAPFQEMVALALSNPANTIPLAARTWIYWINDGGVRNKGWQKNTGVDFSLSYDWEWDSIGAFNTGILGTYYIKQEGVFVPGAPGTLGDVFDNLYNTTINAGLGLIMTGVESLPRFKYRARLGWSNGTWSVTGFMDYQSHFFHTQSSPPNVNNNCLSTGGTIGGGTFPCAIANYTNIVPPYYTFDLSVGYDTGAAPANEDLRNIGIQLVVQNLAGRDAPYAYRISTGGGSQCACDITKSLYGRRFQVRVTKTW
jgi:iron complex outermembrane receptor protein